MLQRRIIRVYQWGYDFCVVYWCARLSCPYYRQSEVAGRAVNVEDHLAHRVKSRKESTLVTG